MRIGALALRNGLFVAPMAGITDRPFRQLARRFGAGLAVSEMVGSRPELRESRKTRLRLDHAGETGPISVQIAGADPQMMAEAARLNMAPLEREVGTLSGGNVQRVVLVRAFASAAVEFLAVAYPSRGLDVASVRATQEILLERRAAGVGILMVSEDIDELMMVADRIVVLHAGEVAGIVTPGETDRQTIGRLMLEGAAA